MEPTPRIALPSGTVTFLLTDIEGSTGWWERAPADMRDALASHDALVAGIVERHGGAIVKHLGDGCWAAFGSASSATEAAVDFQRRHQQTRAAAALPLKVRIGLHTGNADPTDGDYFGPTVNRAARVVDLANGDQIICSAATASLLGDAVDLRNDGPHELRGIGTEQIFIILAEGVETSPERLRRPIRRSNLPRPTTTLVGRHDDLASAVDFIDEGVQLLTLVGPGGVGKTRLATEIGTRVSDSFRGHVYFCDLAPLGNGNDVAEAVADVVGARLQPGMTIVESLTDYLAGRRVLIILDNCEHVIDAARQLSAQLLTVDDVTILATSLAALGLSAEQLLVVPPLPTASDGIDLFVDRARRYDAHFALTDANRDAVLDVVRRLDGIPLAIELAAARIRLVTPAELAARLHDSHQLLEQGGGADRHRTLRETLRWSYSLLAPAEAALFDRLSVFAGGFDLAAVEAVCVDGTLVTATAVPDLLLALVDKSMVVSSDVGGFRRFKMLETLRLFAAEQLADSGETNRFLRHHADHFLGLARQQNERFYSAAEPDAWRVLDLEWPNLRRSLDTFEAAGDVDGGADLVLALVWYAGMAMRFELFGWAEELLGTEGIESHARYADLCGAAALGSYFTVDGRVDDWAERGLAANPADPEGFCRIALASVFLNNVHTPDASDALTTAWLASAPATFGSRLWAHAFRTFHLCVHDPTPEAAEQAAAVTALANRTGSVTARAIAAWAEGQVASFVDLDRAVRIWTEGREWTSSVPSDHLVDQLLVGLILHVNARRGELSSSLVACRDAVQEALARHYYVGTSHLFGVTAIALSRAGDPETGARLVGSMIEHGHLPRRNARRELEHALGERLDDFLVSGRSLSITAAANLAIDALDAAIHRIGGERSEVHP